MSSLVYNPVGMARDPPRVESPRQENHPERARTCVSLTSPRLSASAFFDVGVHLLWYGPLRKIPSEQSGTEGPAYRPRRALDAAPRAGRCRPGGPGTVEVTPRRNLTAAVGAGRDSRPRRRPSGWPR